MSMTPIDGEAQKKRVVRLLNHSMPQTDAFIYYFLANSVISLILTSEGSIMDPVIRKRKINAGTINNNSLLR
jgi:hypothetical protein